MKMRFIYLIFFMFLSYSCGRDSSNQKSSSIIRQEEEFELNSDYVKKLQGEYKAILRPINSQTSGYLPTGKAEISIMENQLKVITFLDDDAFVKHRQGIYEGNRCPQKSDDINLDGTIDQFELEKVTGLMLIPLDGDLNQQIDSFDYFPKGRSFTYRKSGDLFLILKDLYQLDENQADDLVKLKSNEELTPDSRIILIYGTDKNAYIPPTALFKNNLSKHLSIAVTCGKLKRKNQTQGYRYANNIRSQNHGHELRFLRK